MTADAVGGQATVPRQLRRILGDTFAVREKFRAPGNVTPSNPRIVL
jgi:hypothetical protein